MSDSKRKKWLSESMTAAVASVEDGMGLRQAARQYDLPVETLRRRVTGAVSMNCKPGPATVLSAEDEEKLASYIVKMSEMGFGLTREDVQVKAFRLVELSGRQHPFRNGMAGRAWLDGFLQRHPKLTLRTAQSLSHSRAFNATREVIDDYFAKLGAMYARLNILTKPMQIYNVDEVGISVVHKPGKVITEMGRKCVWSVTSAEKGKNHTILACVSASGFVLPPFMIYPRKRIKENIKEGAFPGTSFHCSNKGWVNSELYLDWFKFFLANIPPARPILLIEDGHSSHISIEVIELARSNNVYLLCLPSHTTHILQPLDVGVFKSLKSHYSKECRKYLADHPGQVITSQYIAYLVGKAWPLAFSPMNIMGGFKKSGAFPLNPGEVADRQLAPSLGVNPSCNNLSGASVSLSDPSDSSCTSEKSPSLSSSIEFSPRKQLLFQKRFEEGYDLPDPEYQKWLKANHSDNDSTCSKITHVSDHKTNKASTQTDSNSDVLSEVLSLPQPKLNPSKRKRQGVNSKAVHITDADFLTELMDKDEAKKIQEAEKKVKKEEREKRRAEREKKQVEKKKKKCQEKPCAEKLKKLNLEDSTGSESDSESGSDAQCPICGLTYLGDKTHSIWVCCDNCEAWIDFKCSGIKCTSKIPKKYICPNCKN